jgi:hypothetical protein
VICLLIFNCRMLRKREKLELVQLSVITQPVCFAVY